ncbi:Ada metal-binding domain-containing protein [Desulfovibrio aminophilus]|uniref:Ada metal-binding domain-containing protein n=1 Tax=Desulfovibrio aminophilus TaxID=81425 RepID=UPI003396EA04
MIAARWKMLPRVLVLVLLLSCVATFLYGGPGKAAPLPDNTASAGISSGSVQKKASARADGISWNASQVDASAGMLAVKAAGVVYHGNVKSGVFHRPGCRYYDCKNCVAEFPNREAAIKAGYRPCQVCRP